MKHNSNVPAFLSKLWTLVEDPSTNDLICWSRNGSCFQVSNERLFAKEVLPLYFKHNNMASFIRQLNMYGFHKVVHVEVGLPREAEESVEFQHRHFLQGQPQLLELIKRKVSLSRGDEGRLKQQEFSQVLLDIRQAQCRQDVADSQLLALKRENESLWNEVDSLKQKHQQQHKIIRKIIHFIARMVQPKSIAGLKRKLPLMIDSPMGHSHPKYSRPITMDPSQEASAVHGFPLGSSTLGPLDCGGLIISKVTHQRASGLLQSPPLGHSSVDSPLQVSHRPLLTESLVRGTQPSIHPSTLTPADLYCSLDDCTLTTPEEDTAERSELSDPLALIDSSLAQIRASLPDTSRLGLDLLRELFSLTPCPDTEGDPLKKHTGPVEEDHGSLQSQRNRVEMVQYCGMLHDCQTEVGVGVGVGVRGGAEVQGGWEEEDEEEEGTDILPILLKLAQEVSDITYCTGDLPPAPPTPPRTLLTS
ncbi:heat shock factor protein [Amia ocellicauda]|uniref:heat shock factor protein n=1 Tax=Amia ocellicauda TaxID=2972642 RepID=UPI003464967F